MRVPDSPEEHLRRALLDLQEAQRHFVRTYADPAQAEQAARLADDARAQAARWGALARAAGSLSPEDADAP